MIHRIISLVILVTFLNACASIDTSRYEVIKPIEAANKIHTDNVISFPDSNTPEKLVCVDKVNGTELFSTKGEQFNLNGIKELHKYQGSCWDMNSTPAKFGVAALIIVAVPIVIFYALYVHDKHSTW